MGPDKQPRNAWIQHIVEVGRSMRERVGVVLVVNVKGRTAPAADYAEGTIQTEFLSEEELDQIVTALHSEGYYVETLLDEDGFIRWILGDGPSRFPREQAVVYNLAQNGTGPARLSLVAALARLKGIHVADSDAYAVALTQHKFHAASLLHQYGLPTPRTWLFSRAGWFPNRPPVGARVIAKPTHECASIGVRPENTFTVGDEPNDRLLQMLCIFQQPITVQEFIPGYEAEVPVLEAGSSVALAPVGISSGGCRRLDEQVLAYDDVFDDGYGFYDFAEELPVVAPQLRRLAERAFRALGMSTIGRVDFRVTEDGKPVIFEVACKPHLTKHSSVARAFAACGFHHSAIMAFMVGASAATRGWASIPSPKLNVS